MSKSKLDIKIEEIMKRPMNLDFIPQIKANLKEIAEWTFETIKPTSQFATSSRKIHKEVTDKAAAAGIIKRKKIDKVI